MLDKERIKKFKDINLSDMPEEYQKGFLACRI